MSTTTITTTAKRLLAVMRTAVNEGNAVHLFATFVIENNHRAADVEPLRAAVALAFGPASMQASAAEFAAPHLIAELPN